MGAILTSGLPKDFLRPCVMLLLYERPDHGYDLLDRLSELGFDASDPGGVYRTLRKLESDGFVSSGWAPSAHGGPRCRTYRLTDDGRHELERRARELAKGERIVESFLGRYLVARRGTTPGFREGAAAEGGARLAGGNGHPGASNGAVPPSAGL